MKEANFYKPLDKKQVKCGLCNHFCLIGNGKSGLCGARVNREGKLYALAYGHTTGTDVFAIEKKPLYHFYPGSNTYSLGTLGCNLSCANCLNWSISQAKQIERENKHLDFLRPERIVEEAISEDCKSIAYTYNEPTIFIEYALDIMKLACANSLKNVWVSNGFMSDSCLEAILPYLDAINVDLKSFDDSFYIKNCQARLEPILKNLIKIKQEATHLEITTLIIPGLSDNMEMLKRLADFIANELDADTPWHITKFSPEISWSLGDTPATSEDIIYEAYEIGKSAGLKYVYTGNMPGDQKENTYCPRCGELAIRRMGYHIERMDTQGHCPNCDRSLDIIG